MCVRFEGTKEEIGESSSHMELVVSKEEESSTSGRTIDESIHVEHEQDHLCLMGHKQEVSNSNSNNVENLNDDLMMIFKIVGPIRYTEGGGR